MYNEWYLLTVLLIFRCLGRKYCPDCGCYFSPTHAPRRILHYFTGLLDVKHTAVFPFPTTLFCWYKLRLSFVHCITHVNDKYLEWRYIEIDFFFPLPAFNCLWSQSLHWSNFAICLEMAACSPQTGHQWKETLPSFLALRKFLTRLNKAFETNKIQ